jgi:succinate dehydrogenase hydrophobic anchor subunit
MLFEPKVAPSAHWLIQRATALLLLPTFILATSIQTALICLNVLVFSHLLLGLEEILADYVHHEVTRNLILILIKVLLLIISKYVFVFVLTLV